MNKDYTIGIDIGSTSAKTVVMDDAGILWQDVRPTGWSSTMAAEKIQNDLALAGLPVGNGRVVATGYGRVSVPFADRTITEITCHARGAAWLYEGDPLLVIDIGGQDTKIIRVAGGQARDFLMNDKCSAGTGRFLEIMAGTLGMDPASLCELARQGSSARISSMCTVFAESEVVSLVGRGEAKENIAFAILDSITDKVRTQAGRFTDGDEAVCLTGGLCECPNLVESLSAKLKRPLAVRPEARFAGAIGAALSARRPPAA
ncbi:MAG: CoA activase [Clostridia bacterium]|nr:CoA activase [Clostridia bacterium]